MDTTFDSLKNCNENVTPQLKEELRYAGFWMRFWAYLLDLIVIGSITRIIINPVFRMIDIPLTDNNMFSFISIATGVFFYSYFVLSTKFFQRTIGKTVFGLKVVTLKQNELTWFDVLFREIIGRFIAKFLFIGYIIVAFVPKKQGLHDLFADTTVVHKEE